MVLFTIETKLGKEVHLFLCLVESYVDLKLLEKLILFQRTAIPDKLSNCNFSTTHDS